VVDENAIEEEIVMMKWLGRKKNARGGSSPMPSLAFRFMAWEIRKRSKPEFTDPVLAEAGIREGMTVLDYGCGPGAFTLAAARIAGADGKVYGLDIHPLAVRMVREKADRAHLSNITAILSDCATGLPDRSTDVVLFYDLLHMLKQPGPVIEEIHRVLAAEGILSVSDHHMKTDAIIEGIEEGGLFMNERTGAKTVRFRKILPPEK
jgi:ubiquinone/menaquinone biosynthesis C-methylase UbiE